MKPHCFVILLGGLLCNIAGVAQQEWVLKLNKDGIKVYTKNCAGSPVKAIKTECELTTTLSAFTAVLRKRSCLAD